MLPDANPSPTTMWLPTVYALAPTARADRTACTSVCSLTALKLWPKRDSITFRDAASSGWPPDRSTLSTSGGA
jgi:hypothetical protein